MNILNYEVTMTSETCDNYDIYRHYIIKLK